MRKIILTSLLCSALAVPLMAKNLNVAQPTNSQFAPIVESTQIYPLNQFDTVSILNLQQDLKRNIERQAKFPNHIRITYIKGYKKVAFNMRNFLMKQGMQKNKIQLMAKKVAIYPLFVEVTNFSHKQIPCTGDNTSACYQEHNSRLQSVVNP